MLVTFLVTVFSTYGSLTVNDVQVQPSMEICQEAKKIHLELPRDGTWSVRGISKPVYIDCIQREVPMKSKPE